MAGMAMSGLRWGTPWTLVVWIGAALLLAAPLVAMRFTSEVVWTARDFATFGTMLLVACGAFELVVRMPQGLFYKAAAALAIGTAFALVWINIAVGVVGEPGERANLLFFGVLAVGVVGAAIGRLRPAGLAAALGAMAVAQAGVGAYVLVLGSTEGAILAAGFTIMWLVSASLLWKAAR